MYLIGYTNSGNRLCDFETKKVIVTRNLVFNGSYDEAIEGDG